ncbi:hypothetical protein Tco_0723538, partial [Tanacetum coccineum]
VRMLQKPQGKGQKLDKHGHGNEKITKEPEISSKSDEWESNDWKLMKGRDQMDEERDKKT